MICSALGEDAVKSGINNFGLSDEPQSGQLKKLANQATAVGWESNAKRERKKNSSNKST